MKSKKLLGLALFVLLLILFYFFITYRLKSIIVDSFEECVEAGYPVMESYPRQCRTSDGRSFVETVPPDSMAPEKPTGDSDVVCAMDVRQCPDGTYVGRIPPDCEFAPCPEKKAR